MPLPAASSFRPHGLCAQGQTNVRLHLRVFIRPLTSCSQDIQPFTAYRSGASEARNPITLDDIEAAYQAQAAERTSGVPSEESLRMLRACYAQLGDISGRMWALEKLVTYFPKKEHWAELIARTQSRQGFGERLALDVQRLKKAATL